MHDVVSGTALGLVVTGVVRELVVGLVVDVVGREQVVTGAREHVLGRCEHVVALVGDAVEVRIGTVVEPADQTQVHDRAVRARAVVDHVFRTGTAVERIRAVTEDAGIGRDNGPIRRQRDGVLVEVVVTAFRRSRSRDRRYRPGDRHRAPPTMTLFAAVADDGVVAGRAAHRLDARDEVARSRGDRDRAVGVEHDHVRAGVGAEVDDVTEQTAGERLVLRRPPRSAGSPPGCSARCPGSDPCQDRR